VRCAADAATVKRFGKATCETNCFSFALHHVLRFSATSSCCVRSNGDTCFFPSHHL
jgi:hypothetical protein